MTLLLPQLTHLYLCKHLLAPWACLMATASAQYVESNCFSVPGTNMQRVLTNGIIVRTGIRGRSRLRLLLLAPVLTTSNLLHVRASIV